MNLPDEFIEKYTKLLGDEAESFLKVLTLNLKRLSIESAEIKLSKRCFESGTPG